MARLPDDSYFGVLAAPQSGRPIASIDQSGYARGAAALAQGVKDIGSGLASAGKDVAVVGKQRQAERDRLEWAKADAHYLIQRKRLEDQLAQETDPDPLAERYHPLFEKLHGDASGRISDPHLRELWSVRRSPELESTRQAVKARAQVLLRQRDASDVLGYLDEIKTIVPTLPAGPARVQWLDTANALFGALPEGFDRAQLSRSWIEDLAQASLRTLPPDERIRMLDAAAESTNTGSTLDFVPPERRLELRREAEAESSQPQETAPIAEGDTRFGNGGVRAARIETPAATPASGISQDTDDSSTDEFSSARKGRRGPSPEGEGAAIGALVIKLFEKLFRKSDDPDVTISDEPEKPNSPQQAPKADPNPARPDTAPSDAPSSPSASRVPENTERRTIAQGDERYATVGNRQFVRHVDGSVHFGEIPPEIASAVGEIPGFIRLPKGHHKGDPGELHMSRGGKAAEIRRAGYNDVGELVDDVGWNYDEVWRGKGSTLLLVKRLTGPRSPMMYVEVTKSPEGAFWDVNSGGSWDNRYTIDKSMLWRRERSKD